MSWKYPEHSIRPGGVVEIDDINRNIGEFAQERDGGLNEHNWEKSSFDRLDCEDDVSIECWSTSQAQDMSIFPGEYLEEYHRIRSHQGWFPIKSTSQTCTITASTAATTLWVMGSMQHIQGAYSFAIVQYAIRVDGVVIPESVTGASSSLDDAYHEADAAGQYIRTLNGSGINQRYRSVSLDTMVSVAPGTHTIELVTRMVSQHTGNQAYFWVGPRELIVLSMRN